MTAATGMPPKLRACACEIATIAAWRAVSASRRRARGVTGPCTVVTTGGREIPRRPASQRAQVGVVVDDVGVGQRR